MIKRTKQILKFALLGKPGKGSRQELDHELSCGQAREFALYLEDYGELLKDF